MVPLKSIVLVLLSLVAAPFFAFGQEKTNEAEKSKEIAKPKVVKPPTLAKKDFPLLKIFLILKRHLQRGSN